MAKVFLMVKRDPKAQGYSILQTFQKDRLNTPDDMVLRELHQVAQISAAQWARTVSMDWVFRIINPNNYSWDNKGQNVPDGYPWYYYDEDPIYARRVPNGV